MPRARRTLHNGFNSHLRNQRVLTRTPLILTPRTPRMIATRSLDGCTHTRASAPNTRAHRTLVHTHGHPRTTRAHTHTPAAPNTNVLGLILTHVPGLPPLPPSALPNPVLDKTSPNYTWFVYHGRRFAECDGIIVNTPAELERSVVDAIADGWCAPGARATPTVYPIGPVVSFDDPPPRGPEEQQPQPHECVRWLDAQPPGSVVFLCFGSGGFFTRPKAHEVAHGLERSGHRFLWVLRGPPAPGARQPSDADLAELLPDGFLERTRGRGMVWPMWAPQKEILGHAAVGGFVTHGGWNSVLESLWFGVPMAPWPRYAEQHLNAFTLVAYLGVAVAMEADRKKNNFVEAAEMERAVKELMGGGEEGRKAREKAVEMKAACRNAVEEGGSSYVALRRLSEELCKGVVVGDKNQCC